MVSPCAGYDSMADKGMWSMVEGSCTAQEHGDGQNRYMARIRRRHGCTTVLGWVPVVCPMTYEHGGDVTMRFRDPLGMSFHLTYSDGLLRDIRYLPKNDLAGSVQPGKRTKKRSEIFRLSAEVEGPCGPGRVRGCSAAQGDMVGPSDVVMSQSPGKMKKCTSGPPRGQTPAGRKKVNPKAVSATRDTAGARTQVSRRCRRPGMATLSEIKKLQRFTDLCLAFRSFLRFVREVVEQDIAPSMGVRFQMMAVRALMEVVEAYLVANFENTNEVAIHSKRTATREELVCSDIFNAFTMKKEQCDRRFEEAELPSCCAEYTDSAEEEDEEEDEGASSSDVEVSGNDVSSDEEDEEYDVCCDLKAAGGQVTKEWAHAILRLARAFLDPHKVLRVVMKGATPDGALQYAAVTNIMKSCNKGKKRLRVGKGWFVLVNREAVLTTSLTWGVNLSCLRHGATATAWGETLHPGSSTRDAIKMDSGPRVCDCGRLFISLRTLNSHRARACPTVEDERTHGQEMGVVDDVGPLSIGAVNLMSDESEDVGAPENVDGEGGTFEEQQPQPVESFDSSRKLAALIFFVKGGVGMSQSDIDALLSLFTDPRFSTRDIAYRNSRECLTWAGSLEKAAGWKKLDLRCDDWPRDAHAILWHHNWRMRFLSIFHIALQKCETVSSLELSPQSEHLSISGQRSGVLSYHIQSISRADKGVDENGNPRYVIPLSLYSDKTHTDGHQKQTAYPLMMSLADHASEATLLAYLHVLHNRPRDKGWGLQSTAFRKRKAIILHKALSVVLQFAKEASHDGIMIPTTRFGT
ncbi:hypothetical protein CBR_g21213 [Chara braunii]|uniref:Core Histone H2A/H2B/H3 domain-containing protein n=1 Tax=Chara braunii TaxID=69332 RepID=A0A388L109_CHABU|nr:hypothetical protein CBR_g21213 [Chara braunii]|eukprot:GBG75971.1 hypothetical protein CBR_g21213 [Chara braunii]